MFGTELSKSVPRSYVSAMTLTISSLKWVSPTIRRIPTSNGLGMYTIDIVQRTCTCPFFLQMHLQWCKHLEALLEDDTVVSYQNFLRQDEGPGGSASLPPLLIHDSMERDTPVDVTIQATWSSTIRKLSTVLTLSSDDVQRLDPSLLNRFHNSVSSLLHAAHHTSAKSDSVLPEKQTIPPNLRASVTTDSILPSIKKRKKGLHDPYSAGRRAGRNGP